MAGFGDAPGVVKVAFVCIFLGFVLNIVGFALPYWTSSFLGHQGLWQYCFGDGIGDNCYKHNILSDWFESVRTFEAIGFIASIVTVLFVILYVCVSKTSGSKIVAILSSLLSIGTAGVVLLGIFIYLGKMDLDYISWALGLSVAGGILFGLSGILLIISICSK